MAWPTIDVSTPAGNSGKRLGDDYIREFKTQLIQALQIISGYPYNEATRLAKWTTSTRPTSNLTDGIVGYNTTLGGMEHWDTESEEWVPHSTSDAKIQSLIDAVVPVGMISLWSGSEAAIPTGWALCNGSNGTVDLRDKFVIGAGTTYSVGATGGETTHTLTVDEIPDHEHSIPGDNTSAVGTYNAVSANQGQSLQKSWTSGSAGGNQPHNNMPPYYALCFIQRIS